MRVKGSVVLGFQIRRVTAIVVGRRPCRERPPSCLFKGETRRQTSTVQIIGEKTDPLDSSPSPVDVRPGEHRVASFFENVGERPFLSKGGTVDPSNRRGQIFLSVRTVGFQTARGIPSAFVVSSSTALILKRSAYFCPKKRIIVDLGFRV